MKILFISDIHANIHALEAVWKRESDSDYILCAGDLVDWGFHPAEVLDWCQSHGVIAVAGNHDREIAAHYHAMESGIQPPEGTFAQRHMEQLQPQHIAYLDQLPDTVQFAAGEFAFFIKHYYNEDEMNRHGLLARWAQCESKKTFDEVWPDSVRGEHRVILTGHSHQCCLHQSYAGAWYLNPGSISYRVCTDSRSKGAHYAVLQDGEFRLRYADYDRSVFVPMIDTTPLNETVRTMVRYHLVADLPEVD